MVLVGRYLYDDVGSAHKKHTCFSAEMIRMPSSGGREDEETAERRRRRRRRATTGLARVRRVGSVIAPAVVCSLLPCRRLPEE